MNTLREDLRHELVLHFGIKPPLDDDIGLFSNGLIDSLSVMDLVFFLEAKLETPIPPTAINLENFDTVNSMVRLAENLIERGVTS